MMTLYSHFLVIGLGALHAKAATARSAKDQEEIALMGMSYHG